MTREEYIQLFEKVQSGSATEKEKQMLRDCTDEFNLKEHWWTIDMGDREQIKSDIQNRLKNDLRPERKSIPRFFYIAVSVAAVFVVVATAIWHYEKLNTAFPDPVVKKTTVSTDDVLPGTDRATLTLSDGSTIMLDSSGSGLLARQNGIAVMKMQKGQLTYRKGNSTDGGPAVSTNMVTTPVGGQYRIQLEDGTRVWLNAASSLIFPTAFAESERLVDITGEAYFDIAADPAKPFKVRFNGSTVKVLGTQFNIMAYPEEPVTRVTLINGSVKVSNTSGEKLLQPGSQASFRSSGGQIGMQKANMEEAVAWKNGYFVFSNENIHSIMRKLSRWYGTETVYEGDMTGLDFSGSVSRFENVSEVLSMLESTESIHFTLKNRKITVMK